MLLTTQGTVQKDEEEGDGHFSTQLTPLFEFHKEIHREQFLKWLKDQKLALLPIPEEAPGTSEYQPDHHLKPWKRTVYS